MRRILLTCLAAAATSFAGNLHVSPTGTSSGTGTEASPLDLATAIASIGAGDTVWVHAGTYSFTAQISIDSTSNGTSGAPKCVFAVAGTAPVLDFSGETYVGGGDTNPRGIQINGDYWHFRGLEITGAADNGMYVTGNHNVIESCRFRKNKDTGLQIGRQASTQSSMADWPSYNLILNCESLDNYDEPGDNGDGAGENADGFAAKLTCGPGNVFRGCVSHNNIDDGWDLYTKTATGAIGAVTFDRCIAYSNGTLTDGTASSGGDRNGFKLGGSDMANVHYVNRCVAYGNGKNGFTWNSNPGAIVLVNNLAFDNSTSDGNYKFGASDAASAAVFYNNVSFWTSGTGYTDKHDGVTDVDSSNCFWDKSKSTKSRCAGGRTVDASDFAASLSSSLAPDRLADSSLDFSPFALAEGSDLIDGGTVPPDSVLAFDATGYWVGSPDLGPVEFSGSGTTLLSLDAQLDRMSFDSPRSGTAALEFYSASGNRLAFLPLQVEAGQNRISIPAGIRPGSSFARIRLDGQLLWSGSVLRFD